MVAAATEKEVRATSSEAHLCQWWHRDDGRVVCDLCPRECSLRDGDHGFCFVRQNVGGELILATYGRSTGFCIDPVEKKPLNHFYPGTSVLSFGTAGCNLGCKFCQAWEITRQREVLHLLSQQATPEMIAEAAVKLECRSVAFTYNDPIIWAEYAIDTAKACHERGLLTIAKTNGFINPVPRADFFGVMDAANIDLKGFTEPFYQRWTLSHLQPVLDTLAWAARQESLWLEITNLMIPDANDSPDDVRRMCDWIRDNVGTEVPLHFTAFHPDYRMTDRPPTPRETLNVARDIALQSGLKHAYTGNVSDQAGQSTYCAGCGKLLIARNWFSLGEYHIRSGCCAFCGRQVAGRFEDCPGHWGARRQPVDPAKLLREMKATT